MQEGDGGEVGREGRAGSSEGRLRGKGQVSRRIQGSRPAIRRFFSRLLFYFQALILFPPALLLWRVKVRGRRFERGEGGLIVAANHQSWLDAYLVQWAVFPHPLTFLMTEEFFDLPLAGLYFRAVGARPIREEGRPSVAGIKAAYEALGEGKMICLFPEGEIPRDGRMQRGKRGVARIARKSGATILPVGIRGARDVWSRAQPRLRLRGRIELHVGEPLRYEGGDSREDEQTFTDRLMDSIRTLAGESQAPGA